MARGSTEMGREIDQIPDLLKDRSADWWAAAAGARVPARAVRVVVGRGSSGHAAAFASDLLARFEGRPAIDLRPSQADLSTAPRSYDDASAWVFSASGLSPDVIRAAEWLVARRAQVVAICNATPGATPLDAVAAHTLYLAAGEERAIPATKSFVAQLAAAAALTGAERTGAIEAGRAIASLLARDVIGGLARVCVSAEPLVLVASGLAFTAAKDGALKLAEAAGVTALAFTPAEIQHGPIAALSPRARVLWLRDAPARRDEQPRLRRALADRGVPLSELGAVEGELSLDLPECDWARTLVLAVATQSLALELALLHGRDPDRPPGLSKVTAT